MCNGCQIILLWGNHLEKNIETKPNGTAKHATAATYANACTRVYVHMCVYTYLFTLELGQRKSNNEQNNKIHICSDYINLNAIYVAMK